MREQNIHKSPQEHRQRKRHQRLKPWAGGPSRRVEGSLEDSHVATRRWTGKQQWRMPCDKEPTCYYSACVFSVMSDSLWPHGLHLARLLCLWDSPGKNTGVGNYLLLQGIFPTQGSNLHLLWFPHWQLGFCFVLFCFVLFYHLSHMLLTKYKFPNTLISLAAITKYHRLGGFRSRHFSLLAGQYIPCSWTLGAPSGL